MITHLLFAFPFLAAGLTTLLWDQLAPALNDTTHDYTVIVLAGLALLGICAWHLLNSIDANQPRRGP